MAKNVLAIHLLYQVSLKKDLRSLANDECLEILGLRQ